jgi:hypothetical protein
MGMTRAEFVEMLGKVRLYISEDRVTAEDDAAMAHCSLLALYALDHMTDEDFVQESPMWRAIHTLEDQDG